MSSEYRLAEGLKLYIEGKLQSSTWEDRNSGEKKYRTEIVARDIVFFGSPETGSDADPDRAAEEKRICPRWRNLDEDIPFWVA
jgi:single-strand DNA-binding protein